MVSLAEFSASLADDLERATDLLGQRLANRLPGMALLAHLEFRLSEGMQYHFFFMWLFAINGVCYVAYTLLSGEWRELVPGRDALAQAFQVVLHDLGIRKEPLPPAKFNAAQQIAYTGVVLMGLGSLVTGLAIYRPVQLSFLHAPLGGYQNARKIHFLLTAGYCGFFLMHVGQVIRAGWPNFRAMVTGHEQPSPRLCEVWFGRSSSARRSAGSAQHQSARVERRSDAPDSRGEGAHVHLPTRAGERAASQRQRWP